MTTTKPTCDAKTNLNGPMGHYKAMRCGVRASGQDARGQWHCARHSPEAIAEREARKAEREARKAEARLALAAMPTTVQAALRDGRAHEFAALVVALARGDDVDTLRAQAETLLGDGPKPRNNRS